MNKFGLKQEVLDYIIDSARLYGLENVTLFGSRATGRFSDKSDIDLAIKGIELNAFKESLEERCPTLLSFDFIDLSKNISNGLRSRINQEGIVLYEI